jgi:serpin B
MADYEIVMLAQGNNAFALDLYKELKSNRENLFFSPFSISVALGMTYAGAREKTAQQMADVLNFKMHQRRLHRVFKALLDSLQDPQGSEAFQLEIANSLWIQVNYQLLDSYLDIIEENYGESCFLVDFKEREKARQRINEWIETHTNGIIQDLIGEGTLHPDTLLVLTNAIYFKGFWQFPFKTEKTTLTDFFLLSGEQAKVPMMSQKRRFRYFDTDLFQLLELPYIGNQLVMDILLPRTKTGIKELEEILDLDQVNAWLSSLVFMEVDVFIPRFKLMTKFDLSKILEHMGIVDAFSSTNADFKGMTKERELKIDKVIHQAYVDVNEIGTEAAAATGVEMAVLGPPLAIPEFRADHPFIFLIRDTQTNSILFLGRVMDPRD